MTFPRAVARLEQAVFDRLGESAEWQDVGTVRVRRKEADEDLRLDNGQLVATGRIIKVRKSEVPTPAEGQTVQLLDEDGAAVAGELYVVSGEPTLDTKGVWTCQVQLAA